jgi:hypothetical protein
MKNQSKKTGEIDLEGMCNNCIAVPLALYGKGHIGQYLGQYYRYATREDCKCSCHKNHDKNR